MFIIAPIYKISGLYQNPLLNFIILKKCGKIGEAALKLE
jgi:hypothetical protein